MSFLMKVDFKTISMLTRYYSLYRQNHYEVLKLHKNCSEKDIKEAFFKLSKEYHPDKNKNASAQEHFVRIVEAYTVLSKPSTRAQYDSSTMIPPSYYTTHVYKPQPSEYSTRTQNYKFYYEPPSGQNEEAKPNDAYYGVTGVKKLPNSTIILACVAFAVIGLIVQMFVIRESFFMHQRKVREASKKNAEDLAKVRATATENGNELQTKLILERIVTAANPSVATASLGQALASEKK